MSGKMITKKTGKVTSQDDEKVVPVKVSSLLHTIAKSIAAETHEDLGQVIERHAIRGMIAENERVQAALQTRIHSRKG